ncbi:MAG TPA: trehalose-phosphatase [Actinomycetota bacterium]|nr:trehalose-phosphatase [Actinomycetota bacterium]
MVRRMLDVPTFAEDIRSSPDTSGFILDFDGTLSAIVDDPDAATVVSGVRPILGALADHYGLVAILSGRRAEDVASRVVVPGVVYVGVYGAEQFIDGEITTSSKAPLWREAVVSLSEDVNRLVESARLEGCLVEPKDVALSIHFRNSPSPEAPAVLMSWARAAVAVHGFTASFGRMVVELKPTEISKAGAVASLIESRGVEFLVLAGDDSADVEAMIAVRATMGDGVLCVGVASSEQPDGLQENADVMLDNSEEVGDLLRRFL